MAEFVKFLLFIGIMLALGTVALVYSASDQIHYSWQNMADDVSLDKLREPPKVEEPMEPEPEPEPVGPGKNYVVWLNVTGLTSKLIEDAHTPWLDQMSEDALVVERLVPPFPSNEVPALISQATGLAASAHGVLYGTETELANAAVQPIWETAKSQNVTASVQNWPLAEGAASGSDADQLGALVKTENFPRLTMGSLPGLKDTLANNGTKSDEAEAAMEEFDSQLRSFAEQLDTAWPEARSAKNDQLWLVLSSAHGMVNLEKLVSLSATIGAEKAAKISFKNQGAICPIWFSEEADADFREELDRELRSVVFWRVFEKGSYPEGWGIGDGGLNPPDLLLVMKRGYAFTEESGSESSFSPAEVGGPFATHGYPPEDQPLTRGTAIIMRLDEAEYGSNEDLANGTQLYSTVCKLLGIDPSDEADSRALDLD